MLTEEKLIKSYKVLESKPLKYDGEDPKVNINYIIQLSNGNYATAETENIKIWEINKKNKLQISIKRILVGHKEAIYRIIEYKKNFLISGGLDTMIKIWNIETGKCIETLSGHNKWILTLEKVIIDNNDYLFSVSFDAVINIWKFDLSNINSSIKFWSFKDKNIPIIKIIQIDKDKIAAAPADKAIRIFRVWVDDKNNVPRIEPERELNLHKKAIFDMVQLKNKNLVSISNDSYCVIWDVETYQCISRICMNPILGLEPSSISIDMNSEYLYVLGQKGNICVYDIIKGKIEKIIPEIMPRLESILVDKSENILIGGKYILLFYLNNFNYTKKE